MSGASETEQALLRLVQAQINSGTTTVQIPAATLGAVRDEVLEEIRRLCKLVGARIVVRG